MIPRCGRLDPHEPHDVLVGVRLADGRLAPTHTRRCPGPPVIEGGHDPLWAEHIEEQNANYWEGAPE